MYALTGGTLCKTAGTAASSDTISTAGGANFDGTPHNPLTYVVSGVNGTYTTGGATAFKAYVDSGASIGNGVQVQVSYDFTGDGTWDRTETYNYFATNDVAGVEEYNQGSGIKSSTGTFATTFANGKVQIQIWSAIGNGSSTLRVNASAANGQQSQIVLPYH